MPYTLRTPAEIALFFTGPQLVGPGVVPCPRRHPLDIDAYGGVARKP